MKTCSATTASWWTSSPADLADTLALDDFGFEIWQQVADNICLNQTATIRRVAWWGFYGGYEQSHQPPTGNETIRVRFYSARPVDGLPGDISLEESFVNLTRAFTGHIVLDGGLPKEYLWQADLATPIPLAANTVYWLEVVQIGDVDSTFRWESGYGLLASSAYINDYTPNWESVSGSYAFYLSTVPEPAGVFGLAAAWSLVAGRRSGRQGRIRKKGAA